LLLLFTGTQIAPSVLELALLKCQTDLVSNYIHSSEYKGEFPILKLQLFLADSKDVCWVKEALNYLEKPYTVETIYSQYWNEPMPSFIQQNL
jgi:hypothetical protein